MITDFFVSAKHKMIVMTGEKLERNQGFTVELKKDTEYEDLIRVLESRSN